MAQRPSRIPDRDSLVSDLTCVGYKHDSNARLVLEPKDAIRKRGLPSPDEGDALALTFAQGADVGQWAGVRESFRRPLQYRNFVYA
jgi:hypothetical protein